MQYYLKIAKPFSIVLLVLILLFANSNKNNSISLPMIITPEQAQAAAFTSSPFSHSRSSFGSATITNIQLPGILPNNNPSPPTNAGTTNTNTAITTNPARNNPNKPPPPPLIHNTRARAAAGGPTLNDPNLKVEQIINTGLDSTTSMAFLGPNDILVLEKDTGTVHRIVNDKILPEPLLDVNVANQAERGLLGIAIANGDNGNTENGKNGGRDENGNSNTNTNTRHVFLYYTESGGGKDGDDAPAAGNIQPAGNRLYRYDVDENNNKLTNPLLLLDLPASPPPQRAGTEKNHNGGKVLIGPDNNVYVGIGDVAGHRGQAENNPNGIPPDGTGGILRVTQDGQIVNNPPLGDSIPLAVYYAYGMRNTFGMDFDPMTGKLWDSENGDTFGDEINLVNPAFNSGFSQVQGMWETGSKPGPAIGAESNNPPQGLVTFGGKGVYRAPELATLQTIAPTAIKFLKSARLGKQYENTIFMGDVDYGRLYNFKLNEDRTGLALDGLVANKVANTPDEMQQAGLVLGQGFGVITDIQVGPDGYLYILTLNGSIYRIAPS